MNNIHFRFSLLEARFPFLYAEAQAKIAGKVRPADVVADWLKELEMQRAAGQAPAPTITASDDYDAALAAMEIE